MAAIDRRDRALVLFVLGLALSMAASLVLWWQGVHGFWLLLFFPVFLWPFGLRH